MSRLGILAIYAAVVCAGCAVSQDVSKPGYSNASDGGSSGAGGASGGASNSSTGGSTATGGSSSGGSSSTGGSRDAGAGGSGTAGTGPGGSGTGGSSGSSGTGGSGGGNCQTADCQQATTGGAVSGDTGSQSVYFTGSQPEWVKVRVTENDSSIIGHKLKVTATLNSPAGENFDLYLYVNTSTDVPLDCTDLAGSSTNPAGTADTVSTSWGEGSFGNNKDDSRNVSIEVRAAAGTTCAPNATWSLTVKGN